MNTISPVKSGDPAADRWRWDGFVSLLVIVALLVVRLPFIVHRSFDPDEFEHAHASWSVFRGLVPYRDFFEHHTPWYYFLLAPFFRFFSVDESFESARSFLLFARGLSLALTALSTFLLYRLGRLVADRRTGLLAAALFLMQPVLIAKSLEIRPDVPALPFLLGALLALARALRDEEVAEEQASTSTAARLRWFFGGGVLLGGAILCTQKMLFVLPGAFSALGLWALAGGRPRLLRRCAAVLVVFGGMALPLGLTWAVFAAQGAGRQFIANNFLLNARWKLHSQRHFMLVVESAWPMLTLAVLGVVVAVRRLVAARPHGDAARTHVARPRPFGLLLLLATMAGLFAGLRIVPAAYRQYYMMPLPLACVFAGMGLSFLASWLQEGRRGVLTTALLLVLLRWPVNHYREASADRNDRQMERLRYVLGRTRPSDLVLDGWLGTQLFRPHPLYYGFLHREILAMLTPTELDAFLGPLESGQVRPALIAVDRELRYLGPRFRNFLAANYESNDGEFYWPTRRGPAHLLGQATTASASPR